MKISITALMLTQLLSSIATAHDGPHGPEINDGGKFGGQVVAAVIKGQKVEKHHDDEHEDKHEEGKEEGHDHDHDEDLNIKYKIEFVRSETQMVWAFIYDGKMNKVPLERFPQNINAVFESHWKNKKENLPFILEKKNGIYVGQAPKPKMKPFNIEIEFSIDNQVYLATLENQD